MKKLLLSISVLFSFAVYSLLQKKNTSLQLDNLSSGQLSGSNPIGTNLPTTTPPETLANQLKTPLSTTVSTQAPTSKPKGLYNDGQYTGDAADALYGLIQVRVSISGGKISDVVFLQYPNDRGRSVEINTQAMPYLKSEAISAQSANVDIVSGATDTSLAFISSLGSALSKAK